MSYNDSINHHLVFKRVLDFTCTPQDFVKTCLVSRGLNREHEIELRLLNATRPGWEVKIQSWQFTSPGWLIAMDNLWRFYEPAHRLRLHVEPSQTEIRDGQRVLIARWRFVMKFLVDMFYNRCPTLRNADDSIFQFEGTDQHMRVWNWITDNDMMIFSQCRKLHISSADLISDTGLIKLKHATHLTIFGGKRVTGRAFGKLARECDLRQVVIMGFPELTGYDDDILHQLKERHRCPKLSLQDKLIRNIPSSA